jgi:hypothetical protein
MFDLQDMIGYIDNFEDKLSEGNNKVILAGCRRLFGGKFAGKSVLSRGFGGRALDAATTRRTSITTHSGQPKGTNLVKRR